ncbi:hypothetical protein M8J77_014057 [Diaphorina citri]|nr:hypothetical protein M8J77_014057 [Diaphorina citri]
MNDEWDQQEEDTERTDVTLYVLIVISATDNIEQTRDIEIRADIKDEHHEDAEAEEFNKGFGTWNRFETNR